MAAGCGRKASENPAADSSEVVSAGLSADDTCSGEDAGPTPLRIRAAGPLARTFNDSNHVHFAHAKRLGIDPIRDLSQAYHTKRPLVHVTTSKNVLVDSLTHSMPFLVPEAARLLEDIGSAFIDSLARRGARGYRVKVTSMLRTQSEPQRYGFKHSSVWHDLRSVVHPFRRYPRRAVSHSGASQEYARGSASEHARRGPLPGEIRAPYELFPRHGYTLIASL